MDAATQSFLVLFRAITTFNPRPVWVVLDPARRRGRGVPPPSLLPCKLVAFKISKIQVSFSSIEITFR